MMASNGPAAKFMFLVLIVTLVAVELGFEFFFFFFGLSALLNVFLFSPRKVEDVRRLYDMMQQQRADLHGWWGKPLLELMQITSQLIETAPGRAYAGGHWNWGKDFDIKSGMHKKRSFLSLILLFFLFCAGSSNCTPCGRLGICLRACRASEPIITPPAGTQSSILSLWRVAKTIVYCSTSDTSFVTVARCRKESNSCLF
jgi:hypothetical protein